MFRLTRRKFVGHLALAGLAATIPGAGRAAAGRQRKMTFCLAGGSIGVKADQLGLIDLAARHGFESVEPVPRFLARLSAEEMQSLRGNLQSKKLLWGAAGLPVQFRQEEETFQQGLSELPRLTAALQRAGAGRVGTWLSPGHNTLAYLQNFKLHARRLREVAIVLEDHGQRLGLEYVGTLSARSGSKFQFVHTLAQTQELIGEIGRSNVGLVLDSWHWWTAGDTIEQLRALRNQEVVSVDLNDAPAGIPKEAQRDNQRELPAATGVIDLRGFLTALISIGYDGPVRAEPFNKALNALDDEAACRQTIQAMRAAFALLE